jgi:hypothetical protein
MGYRARKLDVYVSGYVAHMRGDKDEYQVAQLYQLLTNRNMKIICDKVQHESSNGIQSEIKYKDDIETDLLELEDYSNTYIFVGADASVPKFMPDVDTFANKVRKDGKVISCELDLSRVDTISNKFIIVDDILGGGATIDMVRDEILKVNPDAEIKIWVEYNEGIHSEDFLNKYNKTYIGDQV